jgi:hypothetical protein
MVGSTRRILVATASALLAVTAMAGASAANHPPAGCLPRDRPACLYTSDLSFPIGSVEVTLTDPARDDYEIPLLVRFPKGASGQRPVIIWHHGGAPSLNGRTRSEAWGKKLARAGYVVIHPSRVHIADTTPHTQECADNGFDDPVSCSFWLANSRFGVATTAFLLDRLEELEDAHPQLDGRIDSEKVAVAGHSAGTTSVLVAAGAVQWWDVEGPVYQDDRLEQPLAFLATGPQGPMDAGFGTGFHVTSFDDIDRPFMFITGAGDATGEPPAARTTGWLMSQYGGKYLSWDRRPAAVHETMNIHKCDTTLRQKHCVWIGSAGLAFFDAELRGRSRARHWLHSNAYEILTGGDIELHRR